MITNVLNLRCSIENHSIIRSRVRTVNSIKARVQHNTENLSFFSFGEDFLTLSAILFSLTRLFFAGASFLFLLALYCTLKVRYVWFSKMAGSGDNVLEKVSSI